MKLKNEIFANGFIGALRNLMDQKLPVSQSFQVRKFVKEVENKSKVYEEQRMALINEYGEKKEDGTLNTLENGHVNISDMEAFNKELVELLNIEEEYAIEKLTLSDDIVISTKDLVLLENILNLE
jgi:hypothetical protein